MQLRFFKQKSEKYFWLNPYKPSVLFVGQRQTMQAQIRHRRTRRVIRKSHVCVQNVLLKVSKGAKIRNRYNQVPHLTTKHAVYCNLFIMGNYLNGLRWKIVRANNLLQFIYQVTIESRFRKALEQERFKSNFELKFELKLKIRPICSWYTNILIQLTRVEKEIPFDLNG